MKLPMFAVNCSRFPLSPRRITEKRRNSSDPIYTNPVKNLPIYEKESGRFKRGQRKGVYFRLVAGALSLRTAGTATALSHRSCERCSIPLLLKRATIACQCSVRPPQRRGVIVLSSRSPRKCRATQTNVLTPCLCAPVILARKRHSPSCGGSSPKADLAIVQDSENKFCSILGARLRGRTGTQRSKIRVLRRFWKGFWRRVLEKGSQKGSQKGVCYGIYSRL